MEAKGHNSVRGASQGPYPELAEANSHTHARFLNIYILIFPLTPTSPAPSATVEGLYKTVKETGSHFLRSCLNTESSVVIFICTTRCNITIVRTFLHSAFLFCIIRKVHNDYFRK